MTTDVAEEYEGMRVDAVVEKLQSRTDMSEADRETLETMTEGIVDRLVGTATRTLRDATDPGTVDAALELFDPELELLEPELEATTDDSTSVSTASMEDTDGN